MKPYKLGGRSSRRWGKMGIFLLLAALIAAVGGYLGVNKLYQYNLQPVNHESTDAVSFTISMGDSTAVIAESLQDKKLIRSSRAFVQYVKSNQLAEQFIAGTYKLSQSMSVQDIVKVLTDGAVAEDLFTIYPGYNLSQIKQTFLEHTHFAEADVDAALDPAQYADHPALAHLPDGATLEGYLYPDSYQYVISTTPQDIIRQSLDEMAKALTPELIAGINAQGLNVHQGVTLASIVEREVGERDKDGHLNDNRAKAAQVFISRLKIGMKLQSNATDNYPAEYDTYTIDGLPPGPISNVSASSLSAVATPSATNFLYFVAGKDCVTRFGETLEQHEQLKSTHGIAAPEDNCRG